MKLIQLLIQTLFISFWFALCHCLLPYEVIRHVGLIVLSSSNWIQSYYLLSSDRSVNKTLAVSKYLIEYKDKMFTLICYSSVVWRTVLLCAALQTHENYDSLPQSFSLCPSERSIIDGCIYAMM